MSSTNLSLGYFDLVAQGNTVEVDVRLDEETADALFVQEATAEAARQEAVSSHAAREAKDVSKLFGDSEDEVEPAVETRATQRARATVVESFESELEKQPQPQLSIPGSRATPTKKKTRA